jgi:hypothetical protein
MTGAWILLTAVSALVVLGVTLGVVRRRRGARGRERDENTIATVLADPRDSTSMDVSTGAVRSVQTAELLLAVEELERIWSPMYLERLARTYWRFLTRVTLGVIRVHYTEQERFVVAFARPFKLLTFQAPEYEMDDARGIVRWRIERGLLVARRGRGGRGYLQIEVRRGANAQVHDRARLHVEVEVANFYPSIASGFGGWIYKETQSRVHVIVTHSFLRSLARLDLAESLVGRFARIEDVPDPAPR